MANLGKGLSALLSDAESIYDEKLEEREIPLHMLQAGRYQPREYFNQEHLESLSESIKKNGILQPLLVRNISQDSYEIIAGERRFRAAKMAGLETVPVVIKDFNDNEAIEIALIENLQREDLSPIEEAKGYKRMMEEFGYTQEQVGKSLDKSRSHVANMLRLLNLPESIKNMLENEELAMGHARALLTANNPSELAKIISADRLTVRQTEQLVAQEQDNTPIPTRKNIKKPKINIDEMDYSDMINLIYTKTKLKTKIDPIDEDRGSVTLSYNSMHELENLLKKIGR